MRTPEIPNRGNSCTLKAAVSNPGAASREERKELGLGKEAREKLKHCIVTEMVTCSWTKEEQLKSENRHFRC